MSQVYDFVTERIIKQLETGTAPWRKPWKTDTSGLHVPHNFTSKKAYRGINTFLLMVAAIDKGYSSNYWLTYKQAQDKGANVRKGEKSEMVIFWKLLDKETEETTIDVETGKTKKIPMLRYYNVFNLDQIDGIEIEKPKEEEPKKVFSPIQNAQTIVDRYVKELGALNHKGNRACYRPNLDQIDMPETTKFDTSEEYYSTLFHEFTHSTGHKTRLDREGISQAHYFGDAIYSKEELIAEFGAAMLCGTVGIETTLDNSAAYINGWLKALKSDSKLCVFAAAAAQRAADYIQGIKFS
jgi:antirestriction protein ArdC